MKVHDFGTREWRTAIGHDIIRQLGNKRKWSMDTGPWCSAWYSSIMCYIAAEPKKPGRVRAALRAGAHLGALLQVLAQRLDAAQRTQSVDFKLLPDGVKIQRLERVLLQNSGVQNQKVHLHKRCSE